MSVLPSGRWAWLLIVLAVLLFGLLLYLEWRPFLGATAQTRLDTTGSHAIE